MTVLHLGNDGYSVWRAFTSTDDRWHVVHSEASRGGLCGAFLNGPLEHYVVPTIFLPADQRFCGDCLVHLMKIRLSQTSSTAPLKRRLRLRTPEEIKNIMRAMNRRSIVALAVFREIEAEGGSIYSCPDLEDRIQAKLKQSEQS